jgi:hypothetical protein
MIRHYELAWPKIKGGGSRVGVKENFEKYNQQFNSTSLREKRFLAAVKVIS